MTIVIVEPSFIGRALTEWLADGRTMQLEEDFTFVDSDGHHYEALKGDKVDGSSIPWFFWGKLAGSPFVGKHRRASILHDIECQKKRIPYKQVHKMYYEACIADGMSKAKAKAFYYGIKIGGPKW